MPKNYDNGEPIIFTEAEKKMMLNRYEKFLRDNAYAIAGVYRKMRAIDPKAAIAALNGVIEYIVEIDAGLDINK
jgi:hypothetical protein